MRSGHLLTYNFCFLFLLFSLLALISIFFPFAIINEMLNALHVDLLGNWPFSWMLFCSFGFWNCIFILLAEYLFSLWPYFRKFSLLTEHWSTYLFFWCRNSSCLSIEIYYWKYFSSFFSLLTHPQINFFELSALKQLF